jgi:hypothetical protein
MREALIRVSRTGDHDDCCAVPAADSGRFAAGTHAGHVAWNRRGETEWPDGEGHLAGKRHEDRFCEPDVVKLREAVYQATRLLQRLSISAAG